MDGGSDATVDGSADGAMPDPNQPVVVTLPPPDAPSPVRNDTCDYGRPPSDVVLVSAFNFGPSSSPVAWAVTESDIFATQQLATECVVPPACTYETRLFRIPRCGGETIEVGGPWAGIHVLIGMSAGRAYVMRWNGESRGYSEVDVSSGEATELVADSACISGHAVSDDHVVLSDSCQDKLLLLSRTAMRFEPIADVIDPGVVAIGTDIAYVATGEGVRWVVLTSGETGLLTDLPNVFTLSADEHAVLARSQHTSASGTFDQPVTLIELDGGAIRTWTGEQQMDERVPVLVDDGYVYSQLTTPEGMETWKTPSADSTASPRRIMRRESNLLRPFGERLYWIERRGFIMTTVEEGDRALHEEQLPVWSERFVAHNNPLQMTAALAPGGDIVAVTTTEGRVDLGGGEVEVPFDRAVLARFDRQGELRWQRVVEGQSLDQQIAVAPDGTIGLAGVAHVSRLSAEGEPIFTRPLPQIARRLLAVDGAGGTYLAELAEGGASALVALDAAGVERWRRTLTLEGPNAPGVVSLAAGAAGALVAIVGRGAGVDFGDGPIDAAGYGAYVALFGPNGALRFWRLIEEGAVAGAQFGPDGIVAIGGIAHGAGVPQAGDQYAFTLAIDLDGTVHAPRILDIAGAEQGTVTADGEVYFLARGSSRPVPALVHGKPVFTGNNVYQPYLVVHVTREGAIDWTGLVEGAESVTLSADQRGAIVGGSSARTSPPSTASSRPTNEKSGAFDSRATRVARLERRSSRRMRRECRRSPGGS